MTKPEPAFDNPEFLRELRGQMLKFAILQLSDPVVAEDAVQEALAGALKNVSTFAGQAAIKTWVFAILKNKIIDTIRQRQKLAQLAPLVSFDGEADDVDTLFDRRGIWKAQNRPTDWGTPEDNVLGRDFWRVFDACLNHLPAQQGKVFMMREFMDMATADICVDAGVSVSNLNVLLHRARLRLRNCLEKHWFQGEKRAC
ncbi:MULTISPECIES: sigma-70 family RNA polymerase sigma factor [unclassified Rhizobium]|uniref:sigma-70 family RNA polymerase sigma factor n=1 Tax=unclassified Rhizobium TaxID=2613769 RepID=UPI001E59A985|nr:MULTISPECIES: sigma-70 family RNA polymerase sigma factor [unclassified Rhizobium]MCD2174933.1 sigma-70 family RNA polymerase sigma factor [Rhizobium sp. C4]MCD2179347.1 sigma-70 family RNA polymerase sigma factor [Rhizobium sp. C1]